MDNQYYIVSLKHTSKGDTALTLWRANHCGYCYDRSLAGVYGPEVLEEFKDQPLAKPVSKDIADDLFLPAVDGTYSVTALPNTRKVREALGIDTKPMKPKVYRTCKMVFRTSQIEPGNAPDAK